MIDRSDEDDLAQLLRIAGRRDPVSPEVTARVKARARVQWQSAVRRQRWQRRGQLALGVAAVVVAAIVWWQRAQEAPMVATLERSEGMVWFTNRRPGAGGLPAQTGIETGPAGRVALRLSGGASLRVDVDSRARLVSATEVLLERGAVYVDTAGATRASELVVRTAFGVARDIGTQFEVRISDSGLRLRVRDGLVNLNGGAGVHMVHASEELRVLDGGAVVRAAAPVSGDDWRWTQEIAPSFVLEGATLRSLLAWYTRETHTMVDATRVPPSLHVDEIIVHGDIRELTPEQALQAVLPTCGLSHRSVDGVLVLQAAVEAAGAKAPGR
jgi:ferric-dicitrate binding protein FerR (iron transport regulator)